MTTETIDLGPRLSADLEFWLDRLDAKEAALSGLRLAFDDLQAANANLHAANARLHRLLDDERRERVAAETTLKGARAANAHLRRRLEGQDAVDEDSIYALGGTS